MIEFTAKGKKETPRFEHRGGRVVHKLTNWISVVSLIVLMKSERLEVSDAVRPSLSSSGLRSIEIYFCTFLRLLKSPSLSRMKYIWTGHMCAVAAYGVCGTELWTPLLNALRCHSKVVVRACDA